MQQGEATAAPQGFPVRDTSAASPSNCEVQPVTGVTGVTVNSSFAGGLEALLRYASRSSSSDEGPERQVRHSHIRVRIQAASLLADLLLADLLATSIDYPAR